MLPGHKREAEERGAQGSTNRAEELVDIIIQAMPEKGFRLTMSAKSQIEPSIRVSTQARHPFRFDPYPR